MLAARDCVYGSSISSPMKAVSYGPAGRAKRWRLARREYLLLTSLHGSRVSNDFLGAVQQIEPSREKYATFLKCSYNGV